MNAQDLSTRLEEYLDAQDCGRTHHVVSDVSEINVGWETEIFTFKSSTHVDGFLVEADLVLRVFPGERASMKASKEYYLMKKLHEAGYPVPPVNHLDAAGVCIGKPFIVMKRVLGKTLDGSYQSDSPEGLREGLSKLVGLFVGLHMLDSSLFVDVPGLSSYSLAQWYSDYIKHWKDEYAPWMTPVIDWIDGNMPCEASPSLCHMDFHGMNIMMDEAGQPYVIDWGGSVICDYRLDLAWTLLLYSTFGGSMFRAPLIESYEGLSGEKIDDLEFFEVLAAARRIIDLVKTVGGGSAGLRSDVVRLMRDQRAHFIKVHDFLEERTGIRLVEFDELLASF